MMNLLQKVSGDIKRWNFREDDDNYYEQPGKLFRLMTRKNSSDCLRIQPVTWRVWKSISKSDISEIVTKPIQTTVAVLPTPVAFRTKRLAFHSITGYLPIKKKVFKKKTFFCSFRFGVKSIPGQQEQYDPNYSLTLLALFLLLFQIKTYICKLLLEGKEVNRWTTIFSQRVRDIMAYSREEAERLQNNYIGPEHLMLAILRDGEDGHPGASGF